MIQIEAVLDECGVLRSCRATGHAGDGRTWFCFSRARRIKAIVCSAVSVLLRTAVQALSGKEGITVRCDAPKKGFLFLEAEYTEAGREFLFASGVFLVEGLSSVAQEYPEHCTLTIRRA